MEKFFDEFPGRCVDRGPNNKYVLTEVEADLGTCTSMCLAAAQCALVQYTEWQSQQRCEMRTRALLFHHSLECMARGENKYYTVFQKKELPKQSLVSGEGEHAASVGDFEISVTNFGFAYHASVAFLHDFFLAVLGDDHIKVIALRHYLMQPDITQRLTILGISVEEVMEMAQAVDFQDRKHDGVINVQELAMMAASVHQRAGDRAPLLGYDVTHTSAYYSTFFFLKQFLISLADTLVANIGELSQDLTGREAVLQVLGMSPAEVIEAARFVDSQDGLTDGQVMMVALAGELALRHVDVGDKAASAGYDWPRTTGIAGSSTKIPVPASNLAPAEFQGAAWRFEQLWTFVLSEFPREEKLSSLKQKMLQFKPFLHSFGLTVKRVMAMAQHYVDPVDGIDGRANMVALGKALEGETALKTQNNSRNCVCHRCDYNTMTHQYDCLFQKRLTIRRAYQESIGAGGEPRNDREYTSAANAVCEAPVEDCAVVTPDGTLLTMGCYDAYAGKEGDHDGPTKVKKDQHMCEEWAQEGYCEMLEWQSWMSQLCTRSCKACDPPLDHLSLFDQKEQCVCGVCGKGVTEGSTDFQCHFLEVEDTYEVYQESYIWDEKSTPQEIGSRIYLTSTGAMCQSSFADCHNFVDHASKHELESVL